ncbi:MAG: AAA family ATPase, partial [Candidatus Nanoarchaeia archaeon]
QNPLEQEGTYPLPEAQLDRFFFKILVGYPSLDELREIVDINIFAFFKRRNKIYFNSINS